VAAAAQRRHGCGSSDGGEGRGGAQKCAAPGASMGLGKRLGRSPGAEDRWRGELDSDGLAVAAGARTPAIVWLSLINKRLEELL
jgi:hypothetical protein